MLFPSGTPPQIRELDLTLLAFHSPREALRKAAESIERMRIHRDLANERHRNPLQPEPLNYQSDGGN